ncbi:MAG: UDP-N-acetylmuramoyl-tripeptide--D-alanyl-D-alanine ligase, partial [Gammaproteobacteria bacterium]
MIAFPLSELAGLLDGRRHGADVSVAAVSSDTRSLAAGELFVALSGPHFDGHDYLAMAAERGACAALVSRPAAATLPLLEVADTRLALGRLARAWRARSAARVVGITGSNGKTTVKEMIASILRQAGRVLATRGNYNNELGLPLTIFQLEKSHDYAVLEMGASKRGDIAYLAGIARPEVGVIINVGPAHLEGFKSLQGVALGKGEMYAALPPGGTAIINAAEPWVDTWLEINKAERVIYFNGDGDNHVRAIQVEDGVAVETAQGRFSLALPLPGQHNLSNALAATAVCLALDIPLGLIKSGLEAVQPVPGRLSL